MSDQPTVAKKRHRSPGYPGIPLEAAIERAKVALRAFNRHPVPVDDLLKIWGYSAGSGNGLVTLASVLKFGLMEDEGKSADRMIRVTELAFNIIEDEREDSPDRLRLIQEAALNPGIHATLWNQYSKSIPPDATLRFHLRRLGFSEGSAGEVIEEYKNTIAYSKLLESDMISPYREEQERKLEQERAKPWPDPFSRASGGAQVAAQQPNRPTLEQGKPTATAQPSRPAPPGTGAGQMIPIPISAEETVFIQGLHPMPQAQWDRFKEDLTDAIRMWERHWILKDEPVRLAIQPAERKDEDE